MYIDFKLCVRGLWDVCSLISKAEIDILRGLYELYEAGITVSDGKHDGLPDEQCFR